MGDFKAYGFNLRSSDYDRIKAMGAILTNDIIDVYDVKSYDIEVNLDDIILIYGRRATRKCEDVKCLAKLIFPDITKLDPALGEKEARQEALQKLKQFKELLDSGSVDDMQKTETQPKTDQEKQKLTEDTLSYLQANKIEILESILRQKESPHWKGITLEGKTIKLTVDPEEPSEDINLTFAEFYALGEVMERLQVKELEIVYKPSTINRKNDLA